MRNFLTGIVMRACRAAIYAAVLPYLLSYCQVPAEIPSVDRIDVMIEEAEALEAQLDALDAEADALLRSIR